MVKKVLGYLSAVLCVVALTGCYGMSTSKQCEVCASLQEGKADGDEWTGEYIHDQFQCKLEGGVLKVQHEEEWKDCS